MLVLGLSVAKPQILLRAKDPSTLPTVRYDNLCPWLIIRPIIEVIIRPIIGSIIGVVVGPVIGSVVMPIIGPVIVPTIIGPVVIAPMVVPPVINVFDGRRHGRPQGRGTAGQWGCRERSKRQDQQAKAGECPD